MTETVEITGDLFSLAPANGVLVRKLPVAFIQSIQASGHVYLLTSLPDACNTRGVWGAGIARRIKELVRKISKISLTIVASGIHIWKIPRNWLSRIFLSSTPRRL
jgi:hypothetical protein